MSSETPVTEASPPEETPDASSSLQTEGSSQPSEEAPLGTPDEQLAQTPPPAGSSGVAPTTNLRELLGSLAAAVAHARQVADLNMIDQRTLYRQYEGLRDLDVPRLRIPEVVLELPIYVSGRGEPIVPPFASLHDLVAASADAVTAAVDDAPYFHVTQEIIDIYREELEINLEMQLDEWRRRPPASELRHKEHGERAWSVFNAVLEAHGAFVPEKRGNVSPTTEDAQVGVSEDVARDMLNGQLQQQAYNSVRSLRGLSQDHPAPATRQIYIREALEGLRSVEGADLVFSSDFETRYSSFLNRELVAVWEELIKSEGDPNLDLNPVAAEIEHITSSFLTENPDVLLVRSDIIRYIKMNKDSGGDAQQREVTRLEQLLAPIRRAIMEAMERVAKVNVTLQSDLLVRLPSEEEQVSAQHKGHLTRVRIVFSEEGSAAYETPQSDKAK